MGQFFTIIKNLLWDDEAKNLWNLFFLISNLFITGLIYKLYIKGVLPVEGADLYTLNGESGLEILISLGILIGFQSLCMYTVYAISKIALRLIKKDINLFIKENNRNEQILYPDEIQLVKEEVAKTKIGKFIPFATNKFAKEIDESITPKGQEQFNKAITMIVTILYVLLYTISTVYLFIILGGLIIALAIVLNIALVLIIEYKSLAMEIYNVSKKKI